MTSPAVLSQPLTERTVIPLRELDHRVRVPGSKSYTNRHLAIASLCGQQTVIDAALISDDTLHFAAALRSFGHVEVEVDEPAARVTVTPTGQPMVAPDHDVHLAGAGTPLRFLISLAAFAQGTTVVTGNARMQERPMGDLLAALRPLGVHAEAVRGNGCPPVRINGSLSGGTTQVSGAVSSQFTSSLIISAVGAADDTQIVLTDELISKPYVDMTVAALADRGVTVERDGYARFDVAAGQELQGGHVSVEPDASGMSYFLAAAAVLGGRVTIAGIGAGSLQGDKGLVDVLVSMGCQAEVGPDSTTLTGGELHGIDIDMGSIPDVVPTLAVVAALARGSTRITNIGSLRVKECDRIAAVATELAKMGITVEEYPDAMVIRGGIPHGARIDTYDDHRIAMAFAIAGLRTEDVRIMNPGCVAKSFPGFWQTLDGLYRPAGTC